MSPPSPPDLSAVRGGPLGRAIIRWADPDRPRRLAERRIGRAVQVAVPLRLRRALARPSQRLLLALTDDTVYLLDYREVFPVGGRVGGVAAALARNELVAHFHSRFGRVRAELSWPQQQTFIAAELPRGARTDELIGLVTFDEFNRTGR